MDLGQANVQTRLIVGHNAVSRSHALVRSLRVTSYISALMLAVKISQLN